MTARLPSQALHPLFWWLPQHQAGAQSIDWWLGWLTDTATGPLRCLLRRRIAGGRALPEPDCLGLKPASSLVCSVELRLAQLTERSLVSLHSPTVCPYLNVKLKGVPPYLVISCQSSREKASHSSCALPITPLTTVCQAYITPWIILAVKYHSSTWPFFSSRAMLIRLYHLPPTHTYTCKK